MKELEQIHFSGQPAFRSWLENNFDTSPGIWLIFYKKQTGIQSITYQNALEEALCFGWIDSLIKKLDEERYARKFTPRTNLNKWSEINKQIMFRLIKEGRMTGEGLKKFSHTAISTPDAQENPEKQKVKKKLVIPEFVLNAYSENEPALTHFLQLPPSCKREYVFWITQAKREETIQKRLSESVNLLKENKKLGLK